MWIDADAAFRQDAPDLGYYLGLKKAIVFSKDIGGCGGARRFGVNTGIFICKRCPLAKRFLRRWRDYPDIGHPHRDQATCRKLLPSVKRKHRIHVVPFGEMQIFNDRKKQVEGEGPLAVHIAGRGAKTRVRIFKAMYNRAAESRAA